MDALIAELKTELLAEYPRMTDAGANRVIGHAYEMFLDRLKTEENVLKWKDTFKVRVFQTVQQSGIVQFESYSENGLSAAIDKDYLLRGITPVARVVTA